MSKVAAVVIGRNEGPRLPRCLRSVIGAYEPVVYVDTDSSDGSQAAARELGAELVELDVSIPFTFGRGRNSGVSRLREIAPDTDYVQFADADCEMIEGWRERGAAELDADPQLGAVFGPLRERFGGEGLFDRLFALEFDPRTEAADSFGGLVMLRLAAYAQAGGYREDMQTFEDHELAFRMRAAGWRIRRLEMAMAIHEGGMTRWREWWRRERRAGHGRAQLATLYGVAAAPGWHRAELSIWLWGGLVPVLSVIAICAAGVAGALLPLLLYGVLIGRIFLRMRGRGMSRRDAALFAAARTAGKLPQLHGAASFLWKRGRA